MKKERLAPGQVRDAITGFLAMRGREASVSEISEYTRLALGGEVAPSSVRSYLRLNTPDTFCRTDRGTYCLAERSHDTLLGFPPAETAPVFCHGNAKLYRANCEDWLTVQRPNSIHAVVTDPPYGLVEYSEAQQAKLRAGRGGVWRVPPSYDGHQRAPLPRFTTLDSADLDQLVLFFRTWATRLLPVLVPGAHVCVAANPLLSYLVANTVVGAGFERRGEIIRLVMTMRGGDRPKNVAR